MKVYILTTILLFLVAIIVLVTTAIRDDEHVEFAVVVTFLALISWGTLLLLGVV